MVATRYRNFNSDSLLYFWVACCYHRYHHGYPLDTTEQPQVRGPGGRGRRPPGRTGRRQPQYLDQILQGFQGKRDKNPRRVGDALAGKISLGLGLHDSWMDQPTPTSGARWGRRTGGRVRGSPGRAAAVLQPCAAGRAGPRQRPDFPIRYRRRDGQWSGAARSARRDPELERQPGMAAKERQGFSSPKNLCIVTGFGDSMRPMFNPGDP